MQVANYGIGGHFTPHLDVLHEHRYQGPADRFHLERLGPSKSLSVSDDGFGLQIPDSNDPLHNRRIATWLGYLSNVKAGGGTAFLDLNIVAEPEIGSAVFWYNLKENGDLEERVKHAACPIIEGKWFPGL